MVVLILTRRGFDDLRQRIDPAIDTLWLNAGVLSASEVADLRASGWNVTTFTSPLDRSELDRAIAVIREHHPGHIIWTETATE